MPSPDHTTEFALATVGAIFWTAVIIKSYRTKSTDGLSIWLMIAWTGAGWAWGTYSITEDLAVPIKVNAHAMTFLSTVCVGQILRYSYHQTVRRATLTFIGAIAAWAAFEILSIFTLWYAAERGVTAVSLSYGYVLVNALCISGLIPQFYEIWKAKRVEGISVSMIIFDVMGGTFFAASCFYAPKLDMPALIFFVAISGLDFVIVILAWTLNPIATKRDRSNGQVGIIDETGRLRLDTSLPDDMPMEKGSGSKMSSTSDLPDLRPLLYSHYDSASSSVGSPITPLTPVKIRERSIFDFEAR